jgi:tetratricopeptide (TPR) repeat protein
MICANAALLDSEEGDWRFSHDKLREGLLDRLPAEKRRQLHADVAGALAANYDNVESMSAVLAYHFKQAGNPDKASLYYLRAGDSAMRLCAYNDARRHYAGGIAALSELREDDHVKRQKIDTLVKQVRASHIADQPKQNMERLEEATSLLSALTGEADAVADKIRRAWVYYWRGRIHYYCGESREALEYHQQVLSVAKEHGHQELVMLASAACGTTLFSQGRVDLALPLVLSTIETFGSMGRGYEWVRGVGHQGLCLMGLGQYEHGLGEVGRAYARALEINKPMILSMTHLYYCMGSMHSGDYPTMLVRGNNSLAFARQAGEKIYESLALGYVSWAENQLGHYGDALAHYQELQQNIKRMGGKLVLSILYDAVHADILLNTGLLDEAIERAQTVVSESKLAENCNSEGMAERTWGLALHRRGSASPSEVDGHMEASVKAFSLGSLMLDTARTRLCWAQICHERGDKVRAQQLLEQGTLPFLASGATYGLSRAQQIAQSWEAPPTPAAPGSTDGNGLGSLPTGTEE